MSRSVYKSPLLQVHFLKMRFTPALVSACSLLQAQSALARPAKGCDAPSRQAAYLITNQDDNAVLSFAIDSEGMLSEGSTTSTGGAGSASIFGSTNAPAEVDPLVGQSALNVAGNVSGTPARVIASWHSY